MKNNFILQTYRNIFTGTFSIFLIALSSLILTPLIIDNVGREFYGLWLIIFNLLGYFYIADFGFTTAIVRIYSKYKAIREKDIYKLLSTTYILVISIDFILILLLLSIKDFLFNFFEIENDLYHLYLFLFYIGLFELSSQLILRLNIGILKGNQRYDKAYNLESVGTISKLIIILSLVFIDFLNIYTFALSYSIIKFIADGLSFYFVRDKIKKIKLLFDKKIFYEIFDLGSSSVFNSLINILINSFPILLFGKLFGIKNVILISIPFSLITLISRFINTIYNGVNPKASELKSLGKSENLIEISSFGMKISIGIQLPLIGLLILFGYDFLYLWLGGTELINKDLMIMSNILTLLLIFSFIQNILKVNTFIFKSSGFHWYITIENLIFVLTLYFFSYLFFDTFDMYIFPIAMIISSFFKFSYYLYLGKYIMKSYSINLLYLIIIILNFIIVYFFNLFFDDFLIRVFFLCLWSLINLSFIYLFLFNKFEKKLIVEQLYKLLKLLNKK